MQIWFNLEETIFDLTFMCLNQTGMYVFANPLGNLPKKRRIKVGLVLIKKIPLYTYIVLDNN